MEGYQQGDDGTRASPGPLSLNPHSQTHLLSCSFQLVDSTGASITNKGIFYEPGKEPGPNDLPKLHLLIESNEEFRVRLGLRTVGSRELKADTSAPDTGPACHCRDQEGSHRRCHDGSRGAPVFFLGVYRESPR